MKLSVVWIDREHARFFHFSDDRMERKNIKLRHAEHHTHARDGLDRDREEPQLFLEAAGELTGSDKILILCPGVAKHHFQTYLAEHQPFVAKKIAGVETVDHPSDGQIAAMAKRFFEKITA